jgi:predicted transcriptional regulator
MQTEPRTPVREVTTKGAISVDEKLTLRSVAAVLAEARVGVVLVRRPDGTVGVVSERDVVSALADGADADEVWAADIVETPVVIAELDEPIVDVAERMVDEDVRHVAVVDRDQIVGVVSTRDVLPVLVEHARTVI